MSAIEDAIIRNLENASSEWYSGRTLWGHNWARWFILLGSRERGKSYDTMDFFLRQWYRSGGVRVFYWIRLYENEQKTLLADNALKLIDPDLKRKWIESHGYELYTNNTEVYVVKRDAKNKIIKGSKKLLCHVLSLAGAGSSKGVGFFDKDYLKQPNAFYNICLDEFNRSPGQKKTFDIVNNLKVQLENLIRSTPDKVRIVCIANNVGSCCELLASWNFIPHEFGIYKLRSKGVLIHFIPNSTQYVARRSKSALNRAFPIEDDSAYTNEVIMDRSLIDKRRVTKPHAIIKFKKPEDTWFVIWDNGIIRPYKNEQCKVIYPMRQYLDEVYNQEWVNMILENFNNRVFSYSDLTTFIKFQSQLEQLKPSR